MIFFDRRMQRIPWTKHVNKEEVLRKMQTKKGHLESENRYFKSL